VGPVKRVARAGVYAAGGFAALGTTAFAVLAAEAQLAATTIRGANLPSPPNASGVFGRDRAEPTLTVALLGDSSAAGYGMSTAAETPGAVLAQGISDRTGRRVRFHDLSVVGALSADLGPQVDIALAERAQVAVVLIGANDVVHMVRPSQSSHHLERNVRRLLDGGVAVLVGTVPDLGSIKPILPPLRQIARWWSRRIALEQTIRVVRAGGRTISLASILGPEFTTHPDFLFGPDQFHPSAAGYARLADVLLPSALAALGLIGDEEAEVATYLGKPVLPIAGAAIKAINTPGTELDPAPRPRRRLGRLWVKAARRRGPKATAPVVTARAGSAAAVGEDRQDA
jgi:lysophospholipase L1-like esterase